MGPAERLTAGAVLLLLGALGFAAGRTLLRPEREVVQPIAFNHLLHADALDCATCHEHYEDSRHSGLPGLTTCLMCHEEALTEEAEEERIRELAASGEEDVFRKLFRLPDNVYYSHRRHVGIGGLECVECHGAIAETETPPRIPLVDITMDFCIECHEDRGVPSDCTRCHR
jgi:hypothetical protein